MQPAVIEGLAENAAFRGRGLLARFLYADQQSWIGRREIAPAPVSDATREVYCRAVRALARVEGEYILHLSPEAAALFLEWETEIEEMLGDGGSMEIMRDWGAKLAGATLRLAAVLHCVEYGAAGHIEEPTIAADVAALAAILDGLRRYDESEPLYRRVLALFERLVGPEHYEVAVNLNNLAAVRAAQGDSDEAERLYQRALAIKEKLLGPDHPDVAVTLNNLAVHYKKQGSFDQAEQFYRRALAGFETALGPQHPNTAACAENLARCVTAADCDGEF